MSQQTVESVIGQPACDEEFRQRFVADPPAVLDELNRNGSRLNAAERRTLGDVYQSSQDRFARPRPVGACGASSPDDAPRINLLRQSGVLA